MRKIIDGFRDWQKQRKETLDMYKVSDLFDLLDEKNGQFPASLRFIQAFKDIRVKEIRLEEIPSEKNPLINIMDGSMGMTDLFSGTKNKFVFRTENKQWILIFRDEVTGKEKDSFANLEVIDVKEGITWHAISWLFPCESVKKEPFQLSIVPHGYEGTHKDDRLREEENNRYQCLQFFYSELAQILLEKTVKHTDRKGTPNIQKEVMATLPEIAKKVMAELESKEEEKPPLINWPYLLSIAFY